MQDFQMKINNFTIFCFVLLFVVVILKQSLIV